MFFFVDDVVLVRVFIYMCLHYQVSLGPDDKDDDYLVPRSTFAQGGSEIFHVTERKNRKSNIFKL